MTFRRKGIVTTLYELMEVIGEVAGEDELLMDEVLRYFVLTDSIKAPRADTAIRSNIGHRPHEPLRSQKRATPAAPYEESRAV